MTVVIQSVASISVPYAVEVCHWAIGWQPIAARTLPSVTTKIDVYSVLSTGKLMTKPRSYFDLT